MPPFWEPKWYQNRPRGDENQVASRPRIACSFLHRFLIDFGFEIDPTIFKIIGFTSVKRRFRRTQVVVVLKRYVCLPIVGAVLEHFWPPDGLGGRLGPVL